MRRPLIVLLGLGVLFGYGSAIGGAMRHHRWHQGEYADGECGSGGWGRWSQRYEPPAPVAVPTAPVAAPAPVQAAPVMPQIIIVQPQAAAPATPAPTVIVQQPPAPAPAPAPVAPAPKADNV